MTRQFGTPFPNFFVSPQENHFPGIIIHSDFSRFGRERSLSSRPILPDGRSPTEGEFKNGNTIFCGGSAFLSGWNRPASGEGICLPERLVPQLGMCLGTASSCSESAFMSRQTTLRLVVRVPTPCCGSGEMGSGALTS